MLKSFTGVALLLYGLTAHAQVSVTGRVTGSTTNESVASAHVGIYVQGTLKQSAMSDDFGNFRLNADPSWAPLVIRVSQIGYKDHWDTLKAPLLPAKLLIRLENDPLMLESAVVSAIRGTRENAPAFTDVSKK